MTSIEWLLSELQKVNYHPTEAMIMYANKLHKQEILAAFTEGASDGYYGESDSNREKYYQETFVTKGSDDHISDISKMVEVPKQDVDKFEKFLDNEIELGLSPKDTIERIKWYYITYFKQPKKD
jgi:hypothetical protein